MKELCRLELPKGVVKIANKFTTSNHSYALTGINLVENSPYFGGSNELVVCDGHKVIFIKEDEIDPEKTISSLFGIEKERGNSEHTVFNYDFYSRWSNKASIYVEENSLSSRMEAKISNSKYLNCMNDMETVASDVVFTDVAYPDVHKSMPEADFYEDKENYHEVSVKVNDVLKAVNSYITDLRKRIANNSMIHHTKRKVVNEIQTCIRIKNITNGVVFSPNIYRFGLVNEEEAETPFEDAFEVKFGGVVHTDKLINRKHINGVLACIDLIRFKEVLDAFKEMKVKEVSIKIPCNKQGIYRAIEFKPLEYQGVQSYAYLMPMAFKDEA